mgnify:CR=1 FL=1
MAPTSDGRPPGSGAIVVGIWSTNERVSDYMPWHMYEAAPAEYREAISRYMGHEPKSREYLRFIVEELKPFIDANYKTRPGRDDTFLMGSSMGALISLYGVIEYLDVFGGAAAVSTHWPSSMMLSITSRAMLLGIAKPMPM